MLAIILIVAGIGVGIWRGIVAHQKPNQFGTSATAGAILYSMIGVGLAMGVYLLVAGVLPINHKDVVKAPLLPLTSVLGKEGESVYVIQNTGDDGREIRSFLSNRGSQTMFRNDLAIPSKMYEGEYPPEAVYTTSSSDYPWLIPFSISGSGYLGQTVELYVPSGTIYYGFHIDP